MGTRALRVMGCVVAAWAAPVAAQNCAPFTDVPATSSFCTSIQWMYNRSITLGCATGAYCPLQLVTREQMAAFMFRLGNVTFQQGGNAFGAAAVLGTTDAQPLDLRVDGARVMRYAPDAISPNVIGGSPANGVTAGVRGATIAGGGVPTGDVDPDFNGEAPNRVTDAYGTIAGGYANRAGDNAGTVTDADAATVGGGRANVASGHLSTVSGGESNSASSEWSAVGGGGVNTASGGQSVVAGGYYNTASGGNSVVAGGNFNTASGAWGTIPGGDSNVAAGEYSFAAGQNAQSQNRGCFTWADASSSTPFVCAGDNAFIARAAGGFYLRTNAAATIGVSLTGGSGTWASVSDRALKEHVTMVDPRDVLERVARMPIATWNYKTQDPTIRHMGPMAQDVHAAFGLGESDRHISTIDADGIALAAIQGLNAKLESQAREKDARIAALEARAVDVDLLRLELAALRRALADGAEGRGTSIAGRGRSGP